MKFLQTIVAVILISSFLIFPSNRAKAETIYDLVIFNGRIVDGTGNPWFRGSIGIKNGKIVKVGRINPNEAKETIDANNKIIAPGFIDVHAHVEDIYDNPAAENFIRMGVTSLVTGNCGSSATDIKEFLGRMKKKPLAVNLGTLVGHNSVRRKVMGLDNRLPTVEEQSKMEQTVEQAMKDGALGISTGLIYPPGTYAKTDEVIGLAKVAARYGGIYASHIRDEGNGVVKAVEEAIHISEQADLPLEISHFKISSRALWGASDTTINLVKTARGRGLNVTVDQYVYTAGSASLVNRLPSWAVAGGLGEFKKRLADEATRKRIIEEMKEDLKKRDFRDYSFAYVAFYEPNPKFNGKNIVEITEMTKDKKTLDAQIEQILEMYAAGNASMIYHMMSEIDIKNILDEPFTMFAADGGVEKFGKGVPHPRSYGNNARVLGEYVRNLKIVSLEDAIRKMTSLPAQTFGLRERGQIRENFAADIVILDENAVADKATYENPHQYATGFSSVIVNGEIIFDGVKMTGKMFGQPLYRNRF